MNADTTAEPAMAGLAGEPVAGGDVVVAVKQPAGRRALLEAAKQLLVEQVPSSVTGRELAERAGVNYGLVHHYFGGKDQAFREALLEMRAEFVESTLDSTLPALLAEQHNPFLRAVALSFADYPATLGPADDHIIGTAVTDGVRKRLQAVDRPTRPDDVDTDAAAKGRAFVLMCIQLGNGIYREMLMDSVGAHGATRDHVDAVVQRLYQELALTAVD